jgi:L-threonate 2-dehydrogenase
LPSLSDSASRSGTPSQGRYSSIATPCPLPPRVKSAALSQRGCDFIDAGIIGGPPRTGYAPRFYASGPGAQAITSLRRFGLDIEVLDDQIGTASGLKMSYAGLTKGFIAIGAAMTAAAARAGLALALRAELKRSQPEVFAMLRARVPAMFPKAYRWVAEMEEIASFLDAPGQGETIFKGAARLYEQIAADWESNEKDSASFAMLKSFFNE